MSTAGAYCKDDNGASSKDYVQKIHKLEERLKGQENALVVEREISKSKNEENFKVIERLKNQVVQYREENIELKARIETIAYTNPAKHLPSAVCQLETRVRELSKQKEELQVSHDSEMKVLLEDCQEKSQRLMALTATNTLFKGELAEANDKICLMSSELATFKEKMEHETKAWEKLKEKEINETKLANNISQMLKNATELRKGFNNTKSSVISELESLNHETIAMMHEMQQNFLKKNNESEVAMLKKALHSIVDMFRQCPNSGLSDNVMSNAPDSATPLAMWAISEAKNWTDAHNSTYEELIKVKATCDNLSKQVLEGQTVGQRAEQLMQKHVVSLNQNIESLQEAKITMELQIDQINNEKSDIEKKLISSDGRVKRYELEIKQLHESKDQIESDLRSAELEAKRFHEKQHEMELELQNKLNSIKRLEHHMEISQDEVCGLQRNISKLNADIIEANGTINKLKMESKLHESEQEKNQQEIAAIQESNDTLFARIVELQKANSLLEAEKRSLEQTVSELADTNSIIDQENAKLNKQKLADEDELHQIQFTNTYLNTKIEEMDKTLSELELTCIKLKDEKDELSQEASILNNAVNKLRRALSEVQIQRSRLSQLIAKAAHEKADLVQEKFNLDSEITRLQAEYYSTRDQLNIIKSEKEHADAVNEELNCKIVDYQATIKMKENQIASLQSHNQQFVADQSLSLQQKDEMIAQLQSKHVQEVEELLLKASNKEKELQQLLTCQKMEDSMRIKELKADHEKELLEQGCKYKQNIEKIQKEISNLQEMHSKQVENFSSDKEKTIRHTEEHFQNIITSNEDKIKALEKKIASLELEQNDAENANKKLKIELELSESTNKKLEHELDMTEKCQQGYQGKMDDMRVAAQIQLDELQAELLEAKMCLTRHKHSEESIQASLKKAEEKIKYYQDMLGKTQATVDQLQAENLKANAEKQTFKRDLANAQFQLEKHKESSVKLHEITVTSEEEKQAALKNCTGARKSLHFAEKSLTELTKEHDALQKSLSMNQKEINNLKTQLSSNQVANLMMKNEINDKDRMVIDLKNELNAITVKCDKQTTELKTVHMMLNATKTEKEEMKLSLAQLDEFLAVQTREKSFTITSLTKSLQQMKEEYKKLSDTINKNESLLEQEKMKNNNLQKELASLKKEKAIIDEELEEIQESYKNTQLSFRSITTVLSLYWGDVFESMQQPEANDKNDVTKRHPNKRYLDQSFESGFSTPTLHDICPPSVQQDGHHDEQSVSSLTVLPNMKIGVDLIQNFSVEKLNHTLSNLYVTFTEHQRVNALLVENVSMLNEKLESNMADYKKLENENFNLKRSSCSVQSAFEEALESKMKIETALSLKLDEITKLKDKIENMSAKLSELNEEVKISSINVHAKDAQITKLSQQLSEKEKEMIKLTKQIAHDKLMQQEHETNCLSLKKNLNTLQQNVARKEMETIQFLEKIKALQALQDLSHTKIKSIQSENASLKESLKLSMEANSNLEVEVQRNLNMHTKTDSENKRLLTKLNELNKQLKQMQSQENSFTQQLNDIQAKQLINEEMKRQSMHEQTNKLTTLESSIKKLNSEKNTLEDKICKHKKVESSLTTEIEELKDALESEKMAHTIGDELCKGLQKENQKLQRRLHESKQEYLQIEEELQTALQHSQIAQDVYAQQSQQSNRFAMISKQNTDLISQVKDLEKKAKIQEEIHSKQIQDKMREVELIKAEVEFLKTKWTTEENSFKKSIEEQEKKIIMMEDQLQQARATKDKLTKRVKKQETAISQFHLKLNDSLGAFGDKDKPKVKRVNTE